jgi:hypothetical protein
MFSTQKCNANGKLYGFDLVQLFATPSIPCVECAACWSWCTVYVVILCAVQAATAFNGWELVHAFNG